MVWLSAKKYALSIGAIAYYITTVLGVPMDIISIFISLMALDYITGVLKAKYLGKVNSGIGKKGLYQKFVMFFTVIATYLGDFILLHYGYVVSILSVDICFGTMLACMFSFNEILSILENSIQMDIPIPKKIKSMFEIMID